jgi:CRP-like cAMP-binding protein
MRDTLPAAWPDLLASAELIGELAADERAALWAAARRAAAPRGSALFAAGDEARHLYLIVSGRLKLVRGNSEGQEVIVRFIGSGEILGGLAALPNAVYPATAVAMEDAEMAVWSREALAPILARFPRLTTAILGVVAHRMGELQSQLQDVSTERVARRVARALLRLAGQLGRKAEGGILIDLPLSRQTLAELTGTTLFTISRLLSGWEAEGLLEVGRERVVIRSPHGLARVAEDLP